MATTRLVLLPGSAEFPDANSAAHDRLAAATGDTARPVLAFDPDDDEYAYWTFVAWQGISGALSAKILLAGKAAGTNSTYWEVAVEAITDGDHDLDANAYFATANTGNTAMPSTQGNHKTLSITLTNDDSIAAGDLCRIQLMRDADNLSDDFAADALVLAVEIQEA